MVRLRRTVLLALVALLVGVLVTRRGRAAPALPADAGTPADELRWPPIAAPAGSAGVAVPATVRAEPVAEPVAAAGARSWVQGSPGAGPDGYPVKVNVRSGIFHVPGGRSYERTVADRWYATPDDAVADGYRAAKA